MRLARTAFLALVLACGPSLAASISNDDVIKMTQAGLSEALVIQSIDAASEPRFDTSADGLIRLKQAGVTDAVIQKIIMKGGGAPAPQPIAWTLPPAVPPVPMQLAASCANCGTVDSLREIDKPGEARGLGAVGGAVVGGLLGRQIAGDGNRATGTVIGAVGGAVAGHQIEKYAKAGKTWEIAVRFDDGRRQTFRQDGHASLKFGDRVRVVNGTVTPY